LRLRPTTSRTKLRLVGTEPVAQTGKREPRPRQVIPFPKDRKSGRDLEERLAELRDLRRRLVRLIYDYEIERKKDAR
jgi:hypothetical protein